MNLRKFGTGLVLASSLSGLPGVSKGETGTLDNTNNLKAKSSWETLVHKGYYNEVVEGVLKELELTTIDKPTEQISKLNKIYEIYTKLSAGEKEIFEKKYFYKTIALLHPFWMARIKSIDQFGLVLVREAFEAHKDWFDLCLHVYNFIQKDFYIKTKVAGGFSPDPSINLGIVAFKVSFYYLKKFTGPDKPVLSTDLIMSIIDTFPKQDSGVMKG
jgi:hypothetical protein